MISIAVKEAIIKKKKNRECYRLSVKTMHGDGDIYENLVLKGSHDEIMTTLQALDAFFELDLNSRCKYECVREAILNAVGQAAYDNYSDFVGLDATNCGATLSMPQSVKLIWIDSFGQKFRCEIENSSISQ